MNWLWKNKKVFLSLKNKWHEWNIAVSNKNYKNNKTKITSRYLSLHRYAETFAKLSKLDFFDLGWGRDVAHLRKYLPNTFFNIRFSPVELVNMSIGEIQAIITKLVAESANPALTGV